MTDKLTRRTLRVDAVVHGRFHAQPGMTLGTIADRIFNEACDSYHSTGEVYVRAENGKYYGFKIEVTPFLADAADLVNASPRSELPADFRENEQREGDLHVVLCYHNGVVYARCGARIVSEPAPVSNVPGETAANKQAAAARLVRSLVNDQPHTEEWL